MNIIAQTLNNRGNILPYIIESHSIPNVIDEVTYDQYESSNPLRIKFYDYENIKNRTIKQTLKTTQNVGAEVVSAYTNPFYIIHKIVNIPSNSQNIVEVYKKYSNKTFGN